MPKNEGILSSQERLLQAIKTEVTHFQEFYLWLEKAMSLLFFEEVPHDDIMLITHSLMGFHLQEHFSTIQLKKGALVLCLDSPDADLRVLKNYANYGIKNYQTYISKLPFPGTDKNLRIAQIYFTTANTDEGPQFSPESKEELRALVKQRNPEVTDEEFQKLISKINSRFLRALPLDRLILALDMFFRAKTRDNCQYEVRYNEAWEKSETSSMQIVLAWKNTPKHNFLFRMARIIHRYGLVMKKMDAAYVDPYSKDSILLLSLSLHGSDGKAVWDVADIPNFLRELVTQKYFASFDLIDERLVKTEAVAGHLANFLRAALNFVHQCLVHIDPNRYNIEKIEEDLCRHPELTSEICACFSLKFDPNSCDIKKYGQKRDELIKSIHDLDTGNPYNDERRKNVLLQTLNLVHFSLKTNYFRLNYTAICFRLDPKYLDEIPFDRHTKFPELPFGIFFMKGMHYFGFHIRFKDLSRGGLRTVYPHQFEQIASERDTVFTECYNLAYTQQKKNKDIPEGGSKGIIFLKPFSRLESEAEILRNELQETVAQEEIEGKLELFRKEQTAEFLYQAQRSYIESLITLVNCDPDGKIRAKYMVDYWKKPEYLYLGPDENMHDAMIEWIASFSKKYDYKPASSFITSKPKIGINHKEFGVTSLGVNCYMHALLIYLGINPEKDPFTVKMSGGPDGDVAGNQIKNLYQYYPKTAKLVALTDVSGTIHDPEGLKLKELVKLFEEGKPIANYPPELLHDGGFLLNRKQIRKQTAFVQQTLCYRKKEGKVVEDWLSGSSMNHLFRNNVHETYADIFIPAGGRPRTLNGENVSCYLDAQNRPTSRAIVEGANLYLTDEARRFLEEEGCLIVKDSSANKAGVICSSFEVLSGLTLGDDLFETNKKVIVEELLKRLVQCASNEANLLLTTLKQEGGYLTAISDKISDQINRFTYEILDHLAEVKLSDDLKDPLIKTYLDYALPVLRDKYQERLLKEIPDLHKKAVIACHIAANVVYSKGLKWSPSIVDVLPILIKT
jgi:glutamate dehydrogenase